MKYRILGKTNEKVSVLGFGIMRLPMIEGSKNAIDYKKSYELIEYAYANGINYFDSAQNYMNGESENILGEAVKNFRDKIYIASKIGVWHLKENTDCLEEHLKSQLERLKSEYIDFYMIHALTDERWEKFKEIGIIDFFERKKREGIIRHYGFSYHGTPFFFKKIVNEYDWDFVQLQVNYIDRNLQAGEEGLIYADSKGQGTIIMEPLRGGHLVNELPDKIVQLLKKTTPDRTLADWGLNWLWNRSDVDIVLSGMSSIGQVEENIRLADNSDLETMNKDELLALDSARGLYLSLIKVPCTMCRYCLSCPADIDIPWIFDAYNYSSVVSLEKAKGYYSYLSNDINKCIRCKKCESQCPQGIKITELLEEIDTYFKNTK
jgi:uncharacterized protein